MPETCVGHKNSTQDLLSACTCAMRHPHLVWDSRSRGIFGKELYWDRLMPFGAVTDLFSEAEPGWTRKLLRTVINDYPHSDKAGGTCTLLIWDSFPWTWGSKCGSVDAFRSSNWLVQSGWAWLNEEAAENRDDYNLVRVWDAWNLLYLEEPGFTFWN